MARATHLCILDSGTIDLKGRELTYENVKTIVLAAGRYSVFEATATPKLARFFSRLDRDPELEIEVAAFPWTYVRRKKEST